MFTEIQRELQEFYQSWSGQPPKSIVPVSAHGSGRRYYRIYGDRSSVIGVLNADRRENIAFLKLTEHFQTYQLPVPEIYAADLDRHIYLEQDLGDDTLYSLGIQLRCGGALPGRLIQMYKQVLSVLPQFQITAGRNLDYSVCYPREQFDGQSIRWDLNYFKYYFLKLADIRFDEQALEDDFDRFTEYLLYTERDFFLYRDFQSRNIMWFQDRPYFIDYQGGRKGALQYDVASLLLDSKADLPWAVRDELLEHYVEVVRTLVPIRPEIFLQHYYGYALVRLMQVFGAYGLRGLYEGKAHFLHSIPYALQNLEGLLERSHLPIPLPALTDAWRQLIQSQSLRKLGAKPGLGLTVHVQSFSYKDGLPRDKTGHGGGFVFDCRALPNPGRFPEYSLLTGQDAEVIRFLDRELAVKRFLEQASCLVDQAVEHHRGRGFSDLTVAFGCTGGQHRSVFCAERLASHLSLQGEVQIDLHHRELERKL
ncbi:MAG: RNase adapter RapZ [Terriglobia bacterium]